LKLPTFTVTVTKNFLDADSVGGKDAKMRYLGSRTPCRVEDQPDHQQLTAQQSNSLYVAIDERTVLTKMEGACRWLNLKLTQS
jgi:hypothetical protein